jgi:hypothetical protein
VRVKDPQPPFLPYPSGSGTSSLQILHGVAPCTRIAPRGIALAALATVLRELPAEQDPVSANGSSWEGGGGLGERALMV